ncbi:lantibiotic dehydratase C-terminal domain-containing protein [Streptomyces tateyamensis]|uniref:lantibiotic dehydratase C-terminal domain-containing protein n=1 Tax=Streptomyces tateyamensis TaxID=565073 RepID=UPI0015E8B659|nr:lantibiotic dehydratase C-terminal domain-containing protein [Streptomyces tateyamensis]
MPDATARDVVTYYHHPVKGPLLRGVLLPLADRYRAQGLRVHLERHWLHGPHLRLRLDRSPGQPAGRQVATAAEEAAEAVRGWLREHPSHSELTAAELLAQAAAAGRVELVPPPYTPVHPDNTVRVEPVDRSATRDLLGPDGTALREDLLRLGLSALHAGAEFLGEQQDCAVARLQLLVSALAAHAAAHPGGLVGGHYSYVSHLEDHLLHEDPDGGLRAGFERQWQAARPTVTALVARIAAGELLDRERPWAHWSAAAWQLTQHRFDAGADLTGRPAGYRERAAATGDQEQLARWSPEIRTRFSEFHQLLRRSDPQGTMLTRPDYLVYRACTNGLYRLFTICDVRPVERYLAAYLVTRAVPELTGHHWRDRLAEVVAAVEAGATVEAAS